ncbi:hypothetical protein PUMCH_002502 [Australozyma saopauloensis]|uniref:Protein ZRG17 n=1 Tax=Australozyma saopauloensis TaxID=291208 RepID=A0AAX4H9K7_9ASCO|nr:hypothetical protein PUMCH_002502 [[Candida] saopauloensis]
MSEDPHTPNGIPYGVPDRSPSPEFSNDPPIPGTEIKPDLFNLSANFSTESLSLDAADTPVTPSVPTFGFNSFKRYHGNDSSLSLGNSPVVAAPLQFSHQRAGLNLAASRPRPRSAFFADGFGEAIAEDNVHSFGGNLLRLPAISAGRRDSRQFADAFSSFNAFKPAASERRSNRSRSGSPVRARSPVRSFNTSPQRKGGSPKKSLAFNFKPQELGDGLSSPAAPGLKPAQRKGHRYKHSSVSMNIFQEPLPIADANHQPDLIPDLFLIPNVRELLSSTTQSQKLKLLLAGAHASTAALVFLAGTRLNQPTFSTLAHLVFYDSLGSIIIACVDVMSNFEVWSKPSIAYPFGLGRLEVLAGFALSTSLIMVGCDLISHFVEEMVLELVSPSTEKSAEHNSHHIHASASGSTNWYLYYFTIACVGLVSWLSSTCIADKTSITQLLESADRSSMKDNTLQGQDKGILDADPDNWSSLLGFAGLKSKLQRLIRLASKNPIRILTLVDSLFLFMVPFVPKSLKETFGFDINEASTFVVASVLCYVGWTMALTLGGILLISFPYSDYDYNVLKATIYDEIVNCTGFKSSYAISKIFLAKANHRLYIVGIDVSMKGGSSDDEARLTFDISRVITDSIKKFDDESQVETTVSVSR